jgi:hypothetical protein
MPETPKPAAPETPQGQPVAKLAAPPPPQTQRPPASQPQVMLDTQARIIHLIDSALSMAQKAMDESGDIAYVGITVIAKKARSGNRSLSISEHLTPHIHENATAEELEEFAWQEKQTDLTTLMQYQRVVCEFKNKVTEHMKNNG